MLQAGGPRPPTGQAMGGLRGPHAPREGVGTRYLPRSSANSWAGTQKGWTVLPRSPAGAASPGAVGGCTDESRGWGREGSGGRVLMRAQGRGTEGVWSTGVRHSLGNRGSADPSAEVGNWPGGQGLMSSSEHFCDLNRLPPATTFAAQCPYLPSPRLSHNHFRGPRGSGRGTHLSQRDALQAAGGSARRRLRADQHHRGTRVSCPPVLPHGDS